MNPPTKKECEQLLSAMKNGSTDARNELIERHLRLVASIALKYKFANIPMEDLMAEGIEGFITALDKFDSTKGNKLSTYSTWWIRQRIQRLLSKFAGPIAIPHDVMQAKRHQNRSANKTNREPNEASAAGLKATKVSNKNLDKRIKMVPNAILSFDEPVRNTKRKVGDLLSSNYHEKDSYREGGSLEEDISKALRFLDGREKKVMQLRYGLDDEFPLKLGEIGERMKISAERVRQLQAVGLRKLRAILLHKGEINFRNVDKLLGKNLRGKTKMSPLELALAS
jgi:RNA polymerase primary sigma factor